MHNAFVNNDNSGYRHWWCAQNTTGDNALIRLQEDSYFISGRLWAFASFFRFARPGSVRVGAESSVEEVYVSAFVNKNGTGAVPVINAAHFAYNLTIDLFGVNTTKVTVYLTDNSHTAVGQWAVDGSTFEASVEPRTMKTFFFE